MRSLRGQGNQLRNGLVTTGRFRDLLWDTDVALLTDSRLDTDELRTCAAEYLSWLVERTTWYDDLEPAGFRLGIGTELDRAAATVLREDNERVPAFGATVINAAVQVVNEQLAVVYATPPSGLRAA